MTRPRWPRGPMAPDRSRLNRRSAVVVTTLLLIASSVSAGSFEVQIQLPRDAKIDLAEAGYQTLAVPQFLIAVESEETDYAFDKEAARFFERLFARETPLEVVDAASTTLPFDTMEELLEDRGFWIKLASDAEADLILTGQVGFRMSNRSGYVDNQSSFDARRAIQRPTFIYRTGATLGLDLVLIEGATGEILYRDRFTKDKTVNGSAGDALHNFFELIRGVTNNVLGIVRPQTTTATRAHLYRSILEGIALRLKTHMDPMAAELDQPFTHLVVSGGGANADLMMQILADVHGVPTSRNRLRSSAAIGCAVNAGVFAGIWSSPEEATDVLVRRDDTFEPIAAHAGRYTTLAAVEADIHTHLDPVTAALSALDDRGAAAR